MANESFRYKVSLNYVNSKNSEIMINSEQIQYIAIDKDYENTNMPVVAIVASIEKNILDDMILNIDNNIVTLGIYRYDINNQSDNITKKYFHDRFIYIIPDDISKTAIVDYPNGEDREGLYRDITIWLLPQDAVNNNRQSINGIFKNASTNSLILQSVNYIGNLLLELVQYDNKYEQVIIPPLDSISSYISYLNNNLSVFYDTPYRFFIDFDMAYIVSSSGKVTEAKNQQISTVEINISNILPESENDGGMSIDTRHKKYVVDINNSYCDFVKNNVTNKLVNEVTTIDASGNVVSKTIEGNESKVTTKINKIINLTNTDANAINNIAASIENNNIQITVSKNDLDTNMFTINKEYIITNVPEREEYNGRYILCSTKQFFMKQTDYFLMNTILKFKKV